MKWITIKFETVYDKRYNEQSEKTHINDKNFKIHKAEIGIIEFMKNSS